eukprot:CAMPEP_0170566730 /NCGR_PEP_ID=MMETSP0211-20121228/80023_1 /TAXON_ID=311385 /ORGANISM="Pseudokeronopsis sp., Strain OXSARD2" /LENGTH=95 /DNA_ID=CAMNT_0010887983 /DNA_START=2555 /DNA_END=2842 /DNA_ORIENTATION=-
MEVVWYDSHETGAETSFLFYFTMPSILESDSKAVIEFPDATISVLYEEGEDIEIDCTDEEEEITFTCTYTNSSLDFIEQITIEDFCEQIDCTNTT